MSRMIDDEEALQDNGLIEVDGVDVSGCYFFYKGECRCELNCIDLYKNETIIELAKRTPEHNYMECKPSDNCYYKQLQRLKAENEKLKAENEELKEKVNSYNCSSNCYKYRKSEKYKQALEDVRDCINVLSTVDNDFKGSMVEWKINKIINEVLKDV